MSGPESTGFGTSDKIQAVHTRKDEAGKTLDKQLHEKGAPAMSFGELEKLVPGRRFCIDCGEQLKPLLILYCTRCGQRYMVQFDPDLSKPIIVPLGAEEDLIKGKKSKKE